MKMIAVADVVTFQAEDRHTKVVTAAGETLIRKPIGMRNVRAAADGRPRSLFALTGRT